MADYHVLTKNEDESGWSVVFHIPVPNATNSAGYSLRTAIADLMGDTVSTVPWITVAEQTQIDAGEIWEVAKGVQVGEGNSNAAKQAIIEAEYTRILTEDRAIKAEQLDWYGYDGTVT